MGILYFILLIALFFILAVFGVIGGVFRLLFGSKQNRQNPNGKTGADQQKHTTRWYTYNRKKKKIFSDTEGEYVDFEEVKEDKTEHP